MSAPARVRLDILEEHRDAAAWLYARYRRSRHILDGNRAQTRGLLRRLDAHLDALVAFADASLPLLRDHGPDPSLRFVASAVCLRARPDTLDDEALRPGDDVQAEALHDALVRYATPALTPRLDRWLAEGDPRLRSLALVLLGVLGDPRAATIADRAVRRGEGRVRATGLCVLSALGVAARPEVFAEVLAAHTDDERVADPLLDAALCTQPALARSLARRTVTQIPRGGSMAAVLLGLSASPDDTDCLLDAWGRRGPEGALPAALSLAGLHRSLDGAWDTAQPLGASNALREAAYVVLGGEAPPVVVRDDLPEEHEDRAQRADEDRLLCARMADAPAARWRWGALAGDADASARADILGPRHRRWALAAGRLAGNAVHGDWDDLTAREADV